MANFFLRNCLKGNLLLYIVTLNPAPGLLCRFFLLLFFLQFPRDKHNPRKKSFLWAHEIFDCRLTSNAKSAWWEQNNDQEVILRAKGKGVKWFLREIASCSSWPNHSSLFYGTFYQDNEDHSLTSENFLPARWHWSDTDKSSLSNLLIQSFLPVTW